MRDAANRLGGRCYVTSAGSMPPITPNHVFHHVVARTPRQCGIPVSIEDTTPLRRRQGDRNSVPLRVHIVTGTGYWFKNDANLESKIILIDLTITNPCGNNLLDNSARRSRNTVDEAANTKKFECRGTFTVVSYHLPPLAISMSSETGPDSQRLIRVLAEAKCAECGYTDNEEGQKGTIGKVVAGILRLLSCCLDQALSFRTRAYLRRQKVLTPSPTEGTASGSPGVGKTATRQRGGGRLRSREHGGGEWVSRATTKTGCGV